MTERDFNQLKLVMVIDTFSDLFGRVRADNDETKEGTQELKSWKEGFKLILEQIDPEDTSFTREDVASIFLNLLRDRSVETSEGNLLNTSVKGVDVPLDELPAVEEVLAVFDHQYHPILAEKHIQQLVLWVVQYRFMFASWYYLMIKEAVNKSGRR